MQQRQEVYLRSVLRFADIQKLLIDSIMLMT